MKVCGVICEYNPFHNGHAHQLSRAKKLTNADFLVCAMSGAFVQRGEPACLDKWTRAEAALRGGADLVLELPALFAVRAAQDFAFGGVSLLDALGVVTHLSFGAENDDLALLTRLSRPETAEESERIRQGLAQGLSHPAARTAALGVPTPPNVILAAEYLRTLQKLDSRILPVPVKRDSEHRDETLHSMASATAIRAALRRFRGQMVWLILGLMAGSLYAIVMGPAGLQTPQTPVSLQTFSLPGFLLGAAVLLLLELLRAHRPNAEKSSR